MNAAVGIVNKRLGKAIAAVFVLVLAFGSLFLAKDEAHAATFDGWKDSSLTNLIQGYDDNGRWIASKERFVMSDGTIAYCYQHGEAMPTTSVGYWASGSASNAVSVILDYGYPNTTVINGVQLSADEARQATQVAIWCMSPMGIGVDPSGLFAYRTSNSSLRNSAVRAYDACMHLIWLSKTRTSDSHYSLYYTSSSGYQVMVAWQAQNGYIEIDKDPEYSTYLDHVDGETLKGARYGVYSNSSCTSVVTTLTTDANGYAKSSALSPGTYYVKELDASYGFNKDTEVHAVTVGGGATSVVKSYEPPLRGDIRIQKSSADTSISDATDCYSLEGAEYGVYNCFGALADTIVTDENGYGEATGLWVGVYTVKELTAPPGYELDKTEYTVDLSIATSLSTGYRTLYVKEVPKTVDVRFYADYEAGDTDPVYTVKKLPLGYELKTSDAILATADSKAAKANCTRLESWYTNTACTKAFGGKKLMTNLNLYAENIVTLRYDSCTVTTPTMASFGDAGVAFMASNAAGGEFGNGNSLIEVNPTGDAVAGDSRPLLYAEPAEYVWGDMVTLVDPSYDPLFYQDEEHGDRWRTLRAYNDYFTKPDASGSTVSALKLTSDRTVYKAWDYSTYDGVVDDSRV